MFRVLPQHNVGILIIIYSERRGKPLLLADAEAHRKRSKTYTNIYLKIIIFLCIQKEMRKIQQAFHAYRLSAHNLY